MSWYRVVLCALCLAVADGAWLYPLLGLTGFVAGLGHAPVTLAALEAVLAAGVVTTALAATLPPARRAARVLPPALAVASVWAGVWLCAERVGVAAGPAWPLELARLAHPPAAAAALLIVTAILAWSWHHAARNTRNGSGAPRIARGFRIGLVAMVTVLAFEAAGRLDLGTRAALAPFFVASLLGLAFARAPVHGSRTRAWLVLTLGAVVVVLATGTLLGVALVVAVRGGFDAVWRLWLEFATAATESVGDTLHALLGDADASPATAYRPPVLDTADWFVMAVLLAGAAVMAALARRLLRAARPEQPPVRLELGEAQREALEAPDTMAAGRWVDRITPRWLRRSRRPAAAAGDPASASARVHALYARLLALAAGEGIAFNAAETPWERAAVLRPALPDAPVDAVTQALVDVRYRGATPAPARIDALARALEARRGD